MSWPSGGFHFCSQVAFQQRRTDGFQLIVVPILHRALAPRVHDQGTLFRLEELVTAIGHQALDHVIEGVVVIVVQDDVPTSGHRFIEDDFLFDQRLFFGLGVPERFHTTKLGITGKAGCAFILIHIPQFRRLEPPYRHRGTN